MRHVDSQALFSGFLFFLKSILVVFGVFGVPSPYILIWFEWNYGINKAHNYSVTPPKLSLRRNRWFPRLWETGVLSCGLHSCVLSSDSVCLSVGATPGKFVLSWFWQVWKDCGRRRLNLLWASSHSASHIL